MRSIKSFYLATGTVVLSLLLGIPLVADTQDNTSPLPGSLGGHELIIRECLQKFGVDCPNQIVRDQFASDSGYSPQNFLIEFEGRRQKNIKKTLDKIAATYLGVFYPDERKGFGVVDHGCIHFSEKKYQCRLSVQHSSIRTGLSYLDDFKEYINRVDSRHHGDVVKLCIEEHGLQCASKLDRSQLTDQSFAYPTKIVIEISGEDQNKTIQGARTMAEAYLDRFYPEEKTFNVWRRIDYSTRVFYWTRGTGCIQNAGLFTCRNEIEVYAYVPELVRRLQPDGWDRPLPPGASLLEEL